ncbi:MAG: L-threonylcarbamoyladenylate synthase [ANME-2 cluster archaeon]|nr:L-threonylcarbamoyladenylate synthase [ANME-2 cluster archaeon]MDF1531889.1 L-threonylcarbamoyladenylate synthase [ANME-2 cluster archaeon]
MVSKTRIFKIESGNLEEIITTAAQILRQGGTVAFPTETVYGLGADALNPGAVQKIFQAKGRPQDNPLIVHIADKEQLDVLARDVPDSARTLMDAFWPGPLTLIFWRRDIVPDMTTCGLDTVAVRMPDDPVATALIRQAGTPIAAPSANLSGRPSPTTAEHVIADLSGRIDAVIDGGPVRVGVESTVLDMTREIPVLLRPGEVSMEQLREYVGEVRIGYTEHMAAPGEIVRSPGLKYTHYSPQTRLVLVKGNSQAVVDRIGELAREYREQDFRVGLLVTDETAEYVSSDEVFLLGSRYDTSAIASNLFAGLRYLDQKDLDVIIADGWIGEDGVGEAVRNRLNKAAGESMDTGKTG